MNLRQKSFLFVAISVTLLLVVYVGLSRFSINQSTQRHLQDRKQAVDTAARTLDEFFSRGTAKIDVIATLPLLLNGLQTIAQETPNLPTFDTLHYLTYKSDVFTAGLFIVNEQGRIIWSEPRDQLIVNTEYPPFNQVRDAFRVESAPNITLIPWESSSGKNEILMAATLVGGHDGAVVGYVIGAIPTSHDVITAVLNSRPNAETNAQLVTPAGLVVAGTNASRVMRQLPYRERLTEMGKTSNSGVQAGENIVAFKSLDRAPFLIVTDEPEASALQDIRSLRSLLTGIGIFSMTVVMATLIFVVRSFMRPVELLTEEARRIAAGDLEGRFTTDRSDEIGVLAHTLEDMKLRIRSSYDRLLQSEKMALMGQVVAGIAHELNNPLTIVIGHTELLMMKGVDEKHRQPLTRIHDGAERASKIVKNLLTFARQKKPERKLSDVNSIIGKTVDLRAYELKVSNIELIVDLAPNLPPTLCDPHQVQQVFLNLLVNAEQAMLDANGKGQLSIRTRRHENTIKVLFEDNGPGIPPDNLRRVFDPFFTTKPVGKGTGLGLAICQGIIAEHGGRMTVESTPGFGATFTVELPVVTQVLEERPAAVEVPATVPRARKVLVVDDENHMRELFTELLHSDGHAVMTAGGGREALDLASRDKYDLVITDIKMPDMDGPAFFDELKRQNNPLAGRVLFVTGDLMNPQTLRFLETSRCPWIAKPFEVTVVRDTVRRILSS